jgi:hypothetical protein
METVAGVKPSWRARSFWVTIMANKLNNLILGGKGKGGRLRASRHRSHGIFLEDDARAEILLFPARPRFLVCFLT